jgi:hypothetical protein
MFARLKKEEHYEFTFSSQRIFGDLRAGMGSSP